MIFKRIISVVGLLYFSQAFCPQIRPWLRYQDHNRYQPYDLSSPTELSGSPKQLFFENVLEKLEWMQEFMQAYYNEPQEVFNWVTKIKAEFKPFERPPCQEIWESNYKFLQERLFINENFKEV